jgi:hypothetical protein
VRDQHLMAYVEGQPVATSTSGVAVGEATFNAASVVYPRDETFESNGGFDGARDRVLRGDLATPFTLLSERPFQFLDKYPARDVIGVDASGARRLVVRMIRVERRIYMLSAASVRDEASARPFLDSFAILPMPEPRATQKPTYSSPEEGFRIAMPGTPTREDSGGASGVGSKVGPTHYYVQWFDMPTTAPFNLVGMMDGGLNSIVKQDKVRVTSSEEESFSGRFCARSFTAKSATGDEFVDMGRMVFVPPRLYVVLVRDVQDEATARAFIDSLELVPRKAAPAATTTPRAR